VGLVDITGSNPQKWSETHVTSSRHAADLAANIDVVSLYASASGGEGLLRLAHAFSVGEDSQLSKPVNVSLSSIFSGLVLTHVAEVSLTGNQPKAALVTRKRSTARTGHLPTLEGETGSASWPAQGSVVSDEVTLGPMEVRTFQIEYTLATQHSPLIQWQRWNDGDSR
jgi:hypothetical protein